MFSSAALHRNGSQVKFEELLCSSFASLKKPFFRYPTSDARVMPMPSDMRVMPMSSGMRVMPMPSGMRVMPMSSGMRVMPMPSGMRVMPMSSGIMSMPMPSHMRAIPCTSSIVMPFPLLYTRLCKFLSLLPSTVAHYV